MRSSPLSRLTTFALFAALAFMALAAPTTATAATQPSGFIDHQIATAAKEMPTFKDSMLMGTLDDGVPVLAMTKTTDGRLLVATDSTVFDEDAAMLVAALTSADQSNTMNTAPEADGYVIVKDADSQNTTWTVGEQFAFIDNQDATVSLRVLAVLPTATASYALMAVRNSVDASAPTPAMVLAYDHTSPSDGGMLYPVNVNYDGTPARVQVQNQNAAWTLVK